MPAARFSFSGASTAAGLIATLVPERLAGGVDIASVAVSTVKQGGCAPPGRRYPRSAAVRPPCGMVAHRVLHPQP